MNSTPTVATRRAFRLGEGPLWDDRQRRLLWVDILGRSVLVGSLRDDVVEVIDELPFDDMVGAVALTEDDGLVVAVRDRLVRVAADGSRTEMPPLFDGTSRRFNDGRVDPSGALVVGTLSLEPPSRSERLLRLDGVTAEVIDDDLTLSNGLGWSGDGRLFYSVDTMSRTIHVRDRVPATGALGQRRVFATLGAGFPDGLCVDADDHVWVAVWGEGRVLRLAPDGGIVDRIDVPAPHTSSIAFAGPELDVLVVTTASDELTVEQRDRFPDSGRLFTVRPGARGVPARRLAASVVSRLFSEPDPRDE
jgi:sugar lactone lactonase YvrE